MKKKKVINLAELPRVLTKEETTKLIEELNNGSLLAREKLVEHNIRLVLHIIYKKFLNVPLDKEDLFQIGCVGLLKAIDSYDLKKKINFSTYAVVCIDNEILQVLRKNQKCPFIASLDEEVYDNDEEMTLKNSLVDECDIVKDYENKEIYKIIRELICQLPKREQEITMLYFGFYDNIPCTQGEIAKRLDITQSYVSKIIKKVVDLLGKELAARELIGLHHTLKRQRSKK